MRIIKQEEGEQLFLSSKELDFSRFTNLSRKYINILKYLSKNPTYPKELARKLKVNEQIIYYYVNKLRKMGFIEVERVVKVNGILSKIYKLTSDSFFLKFGDFKKGLKIKEKQNSLLSNFIRDGDLNAIIIVGSPDPHGEKMVRSRDGYLGIDLALFLGSFVEGVQGEKVRMDLQVNEKELAENNLIIVGGPVVNRAASLIGSKIPIYIDSEKKKIISKVSKKAYNSENVGFVCFSKNPFNHEKYALFIEGIRYNGTKAAILALTQHLDTISKGNKNNKKVIARIVEGIDRNYDGVVDDINFLE